MQGQDFEPKIILNTYNFYLKFYLEMKKWPKPERYNLGKRCEELILNILEKLIFASRTVNKNSFLFEANIKLQVLKMLIRAAKDTQVMPTKKYLFLQEELWEIGKMLGGWLKSI